VEPCFVFHPLNAFEDSDGASCSTWFATRRRSPPGATRRATVRHARRWDDRSDWRTVKEEASTTARRSSRATTKRRVGKPHRYGYSIEIGPASVFEALLKHDLRKGRTERHVERPDRTVHGSASSCAHAGRAEDDGWVPRLHYDVDTNRAPSSSGGTGLHPRADRDDRSADARAVRISRQLDSRPVVAKVSADLRRLRDALAIDATHCARRFACAVAVACGGGGGGGNTTIIRKDSFPQGFLPVLLEGTVLADPSRARPGEPPAT
jgi:hypothetical protein